MRNFNIKRQINKLYTLTTVSYFRIAGASWVALLALRGFSLLQIGILESIFHIASSCFEIPSGVVADVFGRKRTLERWHLRLHSVRSVTIWNREP